MGEFGWRKSLLRVTHFNGPVPPEIETPNHAASRCIIISFVFSVSQFAAEGGGGC